MKPCPLFLLPVLLIGVFSCVKYNLASSHKHNYFEEYIPKGEVEKVPIANSEFIFMDLADSTLFLGDMLFSKEQVESFKNPDTKSAFRTESSARWSGTIPFYISPGFSYVAEFAIRSGIQMIENVVTSITFQESSSPFSSNGIVFYPTSSSNYSPVGKQSINNIYLQHIILNSGTAAHEIMHSLGFFHEQSRTDRDSYININYTNIQTDKIHNFNTFTQEGYNGKNYGSYDFESLMHYDPYAWAIDSSIPTITKKDGSTYNYQQTHLSSGDIEALDRLYGPVPHIVSTLVGIDDYSSGDDIRQYYYYSNRIYFGDLSHNNLTINYPKTIKLTLTTYHYEETNPGNNYTSYETSYVNVPAGSTYYDIAGYTAHRYHESYGISYLIHEEDYSAEILL